MDFNVPQILAYFVAWFTIMGGIWALFDRAEVVLKKEVRDNLSQWLKSEKSGIKLSDWADLFVLVFDRIFGQKHFTRKCFARSCVASLISIAIVSAVVIAIGRTETLILSGVKWYAMIIAVPILTTMYNFFPDFFSLLESRMLIGLMRGRGLLFQLALLFLDIVLTAAIFALWFMLFFHYLDDIDKVTWEELAIELWRGIVFWRQIKPNMGIWFYSTFFTSIWVWFFFISGIIVKILISFELGLKKASSYFDVDQKPLRSMGFICMIGITIVFVVIPFL